MVAEAVVQQREQPELAAGFADAIANHDGRKPTAAV